MTRAADDDAEDAMTKGPTTGVRVTLKDVAREAGVHPGTASRALNEETRALVNQETAQHAGSRPAARTRSAS
jgi:hypothetical protein